MLLGLAVCIHQNGKKNFFSNFFLTVGSYLAFSSSVLAKCQTILKACGTKPCKGTVVIFKEIRIDIMSLKKYFLQVQLKVDSTSEEIAKLKGQFTGSYQLWHSVETLGSVLLFFLPVSKGVHSWQIFLSTRFGFTIILCISLVGWASYRTLVYLLLTGLNSQGIVQMEVNGQWRSYVHGPVVKYVYEYLMIWQVMWLRLIDYLKTSFC